MSKFNKIDTLGIIRSTGIVPVFYNKDAELTKKVVKACYDGASAPSNSPTAATEPTKCSRK